MIINPSELSWYLTYFSLGSLLILIILLFQLRKIWQYFAPLPPKKVLFTLAIIIIVGLFFRFQQPLDHILFHDEESYIYLAKMMRERYVTRDCGFGIFENNHLKCLELRPAETFRKEGYPFILAILYSILKDNTSLLAHFMNIAFAILTVILSFLIARAIWSVNAGLFSATLVSLFPLHIQWSATASLEISSLFFILLGILFYVLYFRLKKYILFFLTMATLNFAAYFRPELIVILPISILLFLRKDVFKNIFENPANTVSTIIILIFSIINIIIFALTYSFYIQWFESWEFFKSSVSSLIEYQLAFRDYILWIFILGLVVGLIFTRGGYLRSVILPLLISLSLFLIHNFYHYGSYKTMDILYGRYPMMWFVLLLPIAGFGLSKVIERLKIKNGQYFFTSLIILVLVIHIQLNFNKYFPPIQSIPFKERHAILQFQKANPQCLYISPIPFRDFANGFKSIEPALLQSYINLEDGLVLNQPCIIMLNSYQCVWNNNDVCKGLLEKYSWKKLPYDKIETWQLIL